jgi:exopolyphosphatase/guanosine-5'-triphosphate,3'-diphosphate pyrophosphatase
VWELRGSDLALVRDQLGRDPLTTFSVVVRCGDGHPLVIRNHPTDQKGDPFPTLYWLTCPDAVKAVSRLEADGWIKRLDGRAGDDSAFGRQLDGAHADYARERARWAPGADKLGGVGGARTGIKCLHAHYAHHLAGGPDPAGAWVAEHAGPVHPQEDRSGRVAAVDVGTNSVRLLVLAPTGGEPIELARDMVITRLGEGVDATGRLDPTAVDRTIEVLERYVRRARAIDASRIRVGATSAVRDANNGSDFERRVAEVVGSPPEVLTGEREAELSFLGATTGLPGEPPFQVFDIGGGSTEVVVGPAGPGRAASADVGSVRITERVRPEDPPTGEDVARMRRLAAEGLSQAASAVPPGTASTLVGVAGTTTTVQAIALDLDRYDPEAIHRTVLSRKDAGEVADRLATMTTAERRALPVMAPGREDVIVAGCQILLEVFDRWGFRECIVSESDILDGLALEMVTIRGRR